MVRMGHPRPRGLSDGVIRTMIFGTIFEQRGSAEVKLRNIIDIHRSTDKRKKQQQADVKIQKFKTRVTP